ncbi:ATP-binding cassette domain-containing protein [Terasakiella sp. SH-1]|uniref:ABC transporter ATP-binding protein n=1 Tax=Terasakiella sp. SH-1 TaxID=2560057 RepID=UPI00142FF85C|nr:ATP-binding cassette domain-containing protein [Terasakiella sp. SH-1]
MRDIDLNIETGDVIRINGRNGAGKSTILKIIASIYPPTEGSISISKNCNIAYMDQYSTNLVAHDLTIREHIEAFISHKDRTKSKDIFQKMQSFGLGLEENLDEFVGHLSGGQQQIVALLSVLAAGANLLCLDEYLTALDQKSVNIANQILSLQIEEEGLSVIVVSHEVPQLLFNKELHL